MKKAFEEIIGYDRVKDELKRFCDVLENSKRYEALGVSLPSGILFFGEPGIGKSMMAKAFIETTGLKSFTIRKDRSDGDFTDKIRKTFEQARKEEKSIVLLDDMDKFANEDDEHPDAEEYIAVQACIDDSVGTGVFVIATINNRRRLPKSLLRTGRFDKIIEMKAPEYEDTLKLTKHFLKDRKHEEDVDAEEIARIMTGKPVSDLKTVINDAGISAGYEGRAAVSQKDILGSIVRLIFESPECEAKDDGEFDRVLVHELGHVITAEMLEPGSVTLVSVESYNGDIGGVTMIRPLKQNKLTPEALEKEATWALGGRAATEIVFGEPDVGSGEDLRSAAGAIEKLIDTEALHGFEAYYKLFAYEGQMADKKAVIVAHAMEDCYRKAKKIIAENRDLLSALADALKREKTLTSRMIRGIMATSEQAVRL